MISLSELKISMTPDSECGQPECRRPGRALCRARPGRSRREDCRNESKKQTLAGTRRRAAAGHPADVRLPAHPPGRRPTPAPGAAPPETAREAAKSASGQPRLQAATLGHYSGLGSESHPHT